MKKALALILACVLTLSLILPASAVDVNGQNVIFTIVNNTLAPLRGDTMPIISGGMLFVPYQVITDNFGVGSIYNSRDGLLILSNAKKTIFFDLVNGGCYDKDNQTYAYSAITRGGIIYIPAVFVSSNFGLLCAYYPDSSVVRIKDITSSYSDTFLISMLSVDFENALDEYKKAIGKEEEVAPFSIYFTFNGALGEDTEAVLDALASCGAKAVFFVTRDDILANEALIRRIYVEGHTLGVTCEEGISESAQKMVKELDEANEALDRVLNLKTRLFYIPENGELTEQHREALQAGGYRCWNAMLSPGEISEKRRADDIAKKICEEFKSVSGTTVLGFGYETQIPDVLTQIVDFLREHECTLSRMDEICAPLNSNGDIW